MKSVLFLSLLVLSIPAIAKDVKDFNRVLIQDVQHDLKNQNDQALRANMAPMRGPASVDEVSEERKADEKFEKKNHRQLGMDKW